MTPVLDFKAVAASFGEGARAERLSRDPVAWVEERLGEFLWSKQREIVRSVVENKRTMVASCHSAGKGASADTPLLTTEGWKTYGTVRVGDRVFNEDGKPVAVTAKKVWPGRPHYRVRFNSGAVEHYDAAHEWPVTDATTGGRTLVETRDLAARPGRYKTLSGGIDAVEAVAGGDTVCIEVEGSSHLYLTGRDLVPTHNSHLASRVISWWLDTKDVSPTETRVITTAPSWNQVANVMWAYVKEVQDKLHMPGNITAKATWTFPGYKAPTAYGRKPSDYDESSFQGIHATNVLVVVDEAGGVPESIFTSVEAITTNANARILAIANPDDPGSYMAKVWREESKKAPEDRRWNLITISAFDTPNFTGEDVPERARTNLLQKEWVEDARVRWGETDPRWQAKVLAQFPDVGEDGLFNLGRVLVSMNGYNDFEEHDDRKVLGVDVGLSITGDYSVIALNRGGRVSILDKVKGYDGNKLARLIGQRVKELGGVDEIRIDAVGVGRGVQAVLDNHLPEGTLVRWIVGNAASPNKLKWYNFRAAMYDSVSELINEGALAVPPEDTSDERTRGLYDEFRTIKYEYRGTALLIESKDSLKRRGESSPDTIDAICYASMPAEVIDGGGKDPILELTLDTAAGPRVDESLIIDEWGNEPWSFAPA
jgi:hypothetical protein